MNIFKIPEKLNEIMEIDDPELREQEIKKLDLKVNTTFSDIITYIQSKEADCEAIDNEIKRLNEIKKIRNNKAEHLKSYIKTFMELNDIKRHEFATFSLTLAKNPPRIDILDETVIPDKYKTQEVTIITKIDKVAIKKDIQVGKLVKGAKMTQNNSLRIK